MIWVEAKTQGITGAFTRERRLLEKRANGLASAASAAKRHREYVEELQVLCGGYQMMVDGRERAVRQGLELEMWQDDEGTWQASTANP
jgi:hypothetical protein